MNFDSEKLLFCADSNCIQSQMSFGTLPIHSNGTDQIELKKTQSVLLDTQSNRPNFQVKVHCAWDYRF